MYVNKRECMHSRYHSRPQKSSTSGKNEKNVKTHEAGNTRGNTKYRASHATVRDRSSITRKSPKNKERKKIT